MDEVRTRISKILEGWFLQEPALFQIVCSHELVENTEIECLVRSGKRRLEYNSQIINIISNECLEEALRTEAIRILLKHPYERRPDQCSDFAIAVGSNITIGDNYKYDSFQIEKPENYMLAPGKPYEWYARKVQEMSMPSNAVEKSYSDLSELWEEDELAATMIDGIVESIKDWGSLAGNFSEKLKADTRAKIDWRKVFSGFRASIISSKKKLTRMRPNRRYGFDAIGSISEFKTRLLVAIDVSGSVTSKSLSYFFGVVNNAFRYGFRDIDVIQFDAGVRVVQNLKKVMRDVTVVGRGGTSFQEPVDYAVENGYDGLIILTDGYAPVPVIPENTRIKLVWVCENSAAYDAHHEWMEKLGRVCTIELS